MASSEGDDQVRLPPAESKDSRQLAGKTSLKFRWSDLPATGGAASSTAGDSAPARSPTEISEKLANAQAKIEYQGQLVCSLQAKVSIIEKEMKRLIDENDYLMLCVQDPDFPQRQRSKELIQQLKQFNEARKGQSGKIQPVFRPK